MSHVSIVPNRSFPASAFSLAPSTLSRIHFTFVPEKYASISNPVLSRNLSFNPWAFSSSQIPAVCLDCQTIALYTGSPVSLSHTTVVSRWFVIPIPSICSAFTLDSDKTLAMTARIDPQISLALCSTQPGFGKCCVNSFCAVWAASPF